MTTEAHDDEGSQATAQDIPDPQYDQALEEFYAKIEKRCKKYRDAVDKDRVKKESLLLTLEKDFGAHASVNECMEETKKEAQIDATPE